MTNQELDEIRDDVKLCKRAGFITALTIEGAEKLLAEIDRLQAERDAREEDR